MDFARGGRAVRYPRLVGNEFVTRLPHPELRPFVTRYIGYRQHDVTLDVHRGLPSRHVTLVISLADPIRVVGMPGDQGPADLQALVGGMHLRNVLIAQDRYQCGLHLESLTRCHDPAPEVRRVWRRILQAGGNAAITSLADEVGWSRRHLTQRFREEVGLTPKQAARVVRFERSHALLQGAPRVSLAELAVECGYYDQAHLTNEWRAIAGCSPTRWIADELPFLQDDDTPGAAHSVT